MGRLFYLRSLVPWAVIAVFAAIVVWNDTGPPVEPPAYELVSGQDFLSCTYSGCDVRIMRDLSVAGYALRYSLDEGKFRVANHLPSDFMPAGTVVTISRDMFCPLIPPTYLPSGAEKLIPPPPFSCGHRSAAPPS